jgi:quercetin dioxygenase-like cupin family protein
LTRRFSRRESGRRFDSVGGSGPALRARDIGVIVLLFAFPAFAQPTDNPIPTSGGALIMPKDQLPDPLTAGWKGEKVCTLKEETTTHRLLLCAFPPGVGHERHFHAAHFGYVLEGGRMRITDKKGVREIETKRGSSWRSDGIEWHEAVNIGDTTTSYLIFEPKGQ